MEGRIISGDSGIDRPSKQRVDKKLSSGYINLLGDFSAQFINWFLLNLDSRKLPKKISMKIYVS